MDRDVLLARITPCLENGKIAQVKLENNEGGFGSTEFFVFRSKPNLLNQSFLYYLVKSDLIWKNAVNSMVGASGRQRADASFLKRVKLVIPPLGEQQKIAAILSAYDDLIENNKRRIALLEKMAEEIYREWFVRFRFPGYQTAEFEKGIPKGWEVKRLEDISDITSSKRIFLSDYVSEGIPFYRSKEVIERFNGSEPSSPLYISEEKFLQIDAKFGSPKENDILLTAVGTLGIPLIVKNSDKFYFKDGNLIWFKSKNITHNKFLYFWMQTPHGKGSLLETSIGSSQQAFTIAGLKKIEILLPHSDTLNKFMVMFDAIYTQKQNLISSTNNLEKTKNMLLPRLISGKLSVEHLNIQFPPSMQDANSTH
jgi:type I restriction enzyme S subunit